MVVTGQEFINGAQVLQNGAPVPTTFNSGTQLTATFTLTQPGTFDIQVLNPAPGPATSSDLIGIVNSTPPPPLVNPADASRFLEQATFGATDADIHVVSMNGYQAWLNAQFALPATPDEPFVEQSILINNPPCASGDVKCNAALFDQNNQGEIYFQDAYWQDALAAPDELRQLVREVLREVLPTATHQPNPLKAGSMGSQPAESPIHRVAGGSAPGTSPGGAVKAVRLSTDQELHEFVREVLRLAEDPQRRQDLLAGRLRFTLDPAPGTSGNGSPQAISKDLRQIRPQILRDHEGLGAGTSPGGPGGPSGTLAPAGQPGVTPVIRRVEKGAVTERAVIAAAKAGCRLVLGPRAVLTPLARDKARALGVPVEKER